MNGTNSHSPLIPSSPMCLHAPSGLPVRPQLLIYHYPPLHQEGYFPVLSASRRLILIAAGKGFLQEPSAKGSDHARGWGSVKSATWRVQSGGLPEVDASNGW